MKEIILNDKMGCFITNAFVDHPKLPQIVSHDGKLYIRIFLEKYQEAEGVIFTVPVSEEGKDNG